MANENLIPEIRFPEFSGNWEIKEFGDLYVFKTTNSYSRDNLNYENGSVKNIHYGDIHTKFNAQFDITKEVVPYINEDIDVSKISDESYLVEGDLVIADASEDYIDIGKTIEIINLNNEKTVAGLHTLLARRKSEDIAIGFASYILKTNKVRLAVMKIAQGSKVLSISANRFAKIDLHLPKPNEQTKIASFIGKIDTQIQLLEKEKVLLEKYKKAISKKIFKQEIRFKDNNGNDFPNWEEKSIDDIATLHRGSSLSKSDLDINGINYCIHYGELFTKYNEVIFEVVSKTNIENGILSKKGDVLMPSSDVTPEGLAKASAIIVDNVILGGDINIIRPINVSSIFLSYVLNSNKKAIMKVVSGTTVKHIYNKDLKTLVFSFPVNAEQESIGLFLFEIDRTIKNKLSEIVKVKQFKKSLLQKMFV